MTFLFVLFIFVFWAGFRFPVSQVAPLAQAFRGLLLLVRARLPVSFETGGGLNLAAGSILFFSASLGYTPSTTFEPTFPLCTRTSLDLETDLIQSQAQREEKEWRRRIPGHRRRWRISENDERSASLSAVSMQVGRSVAAASVVHVLFAAKPLLADKSVVR